MFEQSSVVAIYKDVLGGVPVFVKTRVPAKTLLDYIRTGHSVDEFLDDFPTVSRQQVELVLRSIQE
ncbi:MAG: DUF433 domain-containing protein [Chthonomonadales bacterium]